MPLARSCSSAKAAPLQTPPLPPPPLPKAQDVELGGETTFPHIPAPGGDNGPAFSDCARKFLAVKPKKGTAVLFHSMDLEGGLNELSFHEACPVIKGEKWSAPTCQSPLPPA